MADAGGSTLSALSPVSGNLMATVALPSAPFGVAFGAGSVWVTSPADDRLTRVDPRGGRVSQQIPVGTEPTAVTFGLGSVWVANSLDSTVTRVSPSTDAVVVVIPVGDGPDALAVAGGSVWAANRLSATLTRIRPGGIDPAPSVVQVGGSPVALTAATRGDAGSGRGVWVAAGPAVSARPTSGKRSSACWPSIPPRPRSWTGSSVRPCAPQVSRATWAAESSPTIPRAQ